MSPEDNHIFRQELVKNLIVGQAHMTFEDAVKEFPIEQINTIPDNVEYSFWELIEHLRICQLDLLDYMVSDDYQPLEFPVGYWPPKGATTDPEGWQASIDGFIADRQRMVDLINDPDFNIFAPIDRGWEGHNMLREILITADHNAYHVGELGVLRQTSGLW